jgi:glutamyl-tRNA synthetase
MTVRTRIAPSPTGKDIHVGTIATALMNFAWAKKNNGQFVVRIEDTDRTRLVEGGEQKMLETLEAIGLPADESPLVGGPYAPYRQSERLSLYKKYAEELVQKGAAYYCTCTKEKLNKVREEKQKQKLIPKYDKYCLTRQKEVIDEIKKGTSYVIRLNVPSNEKIIFQDVVRGEIKFNTNDIDDQILLKSDGFPTYHLAVVVDDYSMKISHVIRAEEWLPSTPKHILLYEAFGWELPVFAHVSLLRNPDRSKLSKRKNPVWASEYLSQGILPETFLNYLALMGWSHPQGKEIFPLDEYVKVFDLKDLQKTAPVFDQVKLEWMNGEYIRKAQMSNVKCQILEYYEKYHQMKLPEELVEKTIPLVQERIKKLSDYYQLTEFLFKQPKNYEIDLSGKKDLLKNIAEELEKISDWKANIIGERMLELAKKLGVKNSEFFMVLRVAITGKKISPPLNESMEILGKEKMLAYLKLEK